MAELILGELLDAARAVFATGSLATVTLESVAAEADVSIDEVRALTPDDQALRTELVMSALESGADASRSAVQDAPTGEVALDAMLRVFLHDRLENPVQTMIHLSSLIPSEARLAPWTDEVMRERVIPFNQAMFTPVEEKLTADWGEDGLPQGIHPRRLVFVSHAAALGLAATRICSENLGRPLRHSDEDLVGELCRALVAPTMGMRHLAALNDVSTQLTGIRDEQTLIERVPRLLCASLDIEQAVFMLAGDDGGLKLMSRAGRDDDPDVEDELLRAVRDDTLVPPPHYRRCFDEDRTILVENPREEPDWPVQRNEELASLAERLHPDGPFVSTPVRVKDVTIGVLSGHVAPLGPLLDRRDIARIETFASMVGMALDNVRFYATLNAKVEERTRGLREAQAALVQSEKMAALGQLVAGLAHEINTPIGAIRASADVSAKALEILRAAVPADDRKAQRALSVLADGSDTSRRASERVAERVQALKSFARLDEAERKIANLHEGLDSALDVLGAELDDSFTVVREYGDIPEVECFPGQLNQVFMNLLINAQEAMSRGGTIRITTRAVDQQVEVRIRDSGSGIAQEDRERIFDPGFTRKGVGIGTGLGLATSYRIMKRHGGRIEVESEVGVGSAFSLWIPLRLG